MATTDRRPPDFTAGQPSPGLRRPAEASAKAGALAKVEAGSPQAVEVQAVIDAQPVSPLQKLLLVLCFLVIAIDGFDTAIIGFGWAATTVYALVAIPAMISALALATLGIVRRRQRIP